MPAMTLSVGTLTRTKNISAENLPRFIAAYKAAYADRWVAGNPPVPFEPTNQQVFNAFAEGIFEGIKDNILNYERGQAAATAQAGVTDLAITE